MLERIGALSCRRSASRFAQPFASQARFNFKVAIALRLRERESIQFKLRRDQGQVAALAEDAGDFQARLTSIAESCGPASPDAARKFQKFLTNISELPASLVDATIVRASSVLMLAGSLAMIAASPRQVCNRWPPMERLQELLGELLASIGGAQEQHCMIVAASSFMLRCRDRRA
eukprot:4472550-Amphidinium_carterae.4